MKLSVKTSGGIGNIQLQGQLDTNELPSDLAERVHKVLSPARLESFRSTEGIPVPDMIQYEIMLFLGSGVQKFEIDEANAPADVIDVVEELVQEVVRRKRGQKGGRPFVNQ
jgi:hypothetical protein